MNSFESAIYFLSFTFIFIIITDFIFILINDNNKTENKSKK